MPLPLLPSNGDFDETLRGVLRSHFTFDNGQPDGQMVHHRPDGTPIIERGFRAGKAHGLWVERHSNGAVRYQTTYVDGKAHGEVQWFDEQGRATTSGAYAEGAKQGDWIWRHADGSTRTHFRFFPNVRPGDERPHQRIPLHSSHPSGHAKQTTELLDDGRQLQRTFYDDGQLESEVVHEVSSGSLGYSGGIFQWTTQKVGLETCYHPSGKKKSETTYVGGYEDGEQICWDASGKETRNAFCRGCPELPKRKLTSLAKKVPKAKEAYDLRNALEKAKLEWGEHPGALLWLLREERIGWGHPPMWELLADVPLTFDEVEKVLRSVPDRHDWVNDEGLLGIVASAMPKHQEALVALDDLPKPAGLAVSLFAGLLGSPIAKKQQTALTNALTKPEANHGLPYFWVVEDGAFHRDHLELNGIERPGKAALIAAVSTPEAWAKKVRTARAKAKYPGTLYPSAMVGLQGSDWVAALGELQAGLRSHQVPQALQTCPLDVAALREVVATHDDPFVRTACFLQLLELGDIVPDELWSQAAPAELKACGDFALDALDKAPATFRLRCLEALGTGDDSWGVSLYERLDAAHLGTVVERARGGDDLALRGAFALMQRLGGEDASWDAAHDDLLGPDRVLGITGLVESAREVIAHLPLPRRQPLLLAYIDHDKPAGLEIVRNQWVTGEPLRRCFARLQDLEVTDGRVSLVQSLGYLAYPYARYFGAHGATESMAQLLRKAFEKTEALAEDLADFSSLVEEEQAAPEPEPDPIDVLLRLAAAAAGAPRQTIYAPRFLPSATDGLSHVGGIPRGIDAASWPTYGEDDDPMDFAFMLDLSEVPELLARRPDARAVAFFVSSLASNEAYSPYNGETALVWVTEADLAKGPLAEGLGVDHRRRGFELVPIDVPVDVWNQDGELAKQLFRLPARVLGPPRWVQGDEHVGELIVQFDEGFVGMNLGDCGTMYVFEDTQFWQCF